MGTKMAKKKNYFRPIRRFNDPIQVWLRHVLILLHMKQDTDKPTGSRCDLGGQLPT